MSKFEHHPMISNAYSKNLHFAVPLLCPDSQNRRAVFRWRKRIFLKRQELSTSEQEELEQLQKRVEPKYGDWGPGEGFLCST